MGSGGAVQTAIEVLAGILAIAVVHTLLTKRLVRLAHSDAAHAAVWRASLQ